MFSLKNFRLTLQTDVIECNKSVKHIFNFTCLTTISLRGHKSPLSREQLTKITSSSC